MVRRIYKVYTILQKYKITKQLHTHCDMIGKLITILLFACVICAVLGNLPASTATHPERFTDFVPANCPIKCQNHSTTNQTRRTDGHHDDWDKLQHDEELQRRARDVHNSPHVIHEVDPEHTTGFVLRQPLHNGQAGGNPKCIPSKPLDKRPVHLDNVYARPDEVSCVGAVLPRFEYREVREW